MGDVIQLRARTGSQIHFATEPPAEIIQGGVPLAPAEPSPIAPNVAAERTRKQAEDRRKQNESICHSLRHARRKSE